MKQNPLLLLKDCSFTQISSGQKLKYQGISEDSPGKIVNIDIELPHMVDHVFVREDDTFNHPYKVNTYNLLKTVRIQLNDVYTEEIIQYLHAIYLIDIDDFPDMPGYLRPGIIETQNVLLNQKRAFTFLLFSLIPAFVEDMHHCYDNFKDNLEEIDINQTPEEIIDQAQNIIMSDRDSAKETQEKLQKVLHITKTHIKYLDNDVYNTEDYIKPEINRMAAMYDNFEDLAQYYDKCSEMCDEIESMQEKIDNIKNDIDNEVQEFLDDL